jgi:hypothetical protein
MEKIAVMHRRDFIRAALASVAVAMASDSFAAPMSEGNVPRNLPKHLVFDTRYPAATLFARRMQQAAILMHDIRGDVTELWGTKLKSGLERGPMVIGGITTPASLFCLEQMASRYRMTLALRTDFDSPSREDAAAVEAVFSSRQHPALLATSHRRLNDGDALVAWVLRPTQASLIASALA